MNICLMTDKPGHPVLADLLQDLRRRHDVRTLNVTEDADLGAVTAAELARPADVYLLKSHSPRALALGRRLEDHGCRVANTAGATTACQDRLHMARTLEAARIATPRLLAHGLLGDVAGSLVGRDLPVMLKSRFSRRGDLVAVVRSHEELSSLCSRWADEPVVVQEFVANQGWDIKLWAVGSRVFAAHRPSPLDGGPATTIPVHGALAARWVNICAEVGRAFQLDLFGVDLLAGAQVPGVIDVNAFPGYRGVPGAVPAMTAWIESLNPVEVLA